MPGRVEVQAAETWRPRYWNATGWESASRGRSRHGNGISKDTEAGMVRTDLETIQKTGLPGASKNYSSCLRLELGSVVLSHFPGMTEDIHAEKAVQGAKVTLCSGFRFQPQSI